MDWEFNYKPHEDLFGFVRSRLLLMSKHPLMFASLRGEFIGRVSTLLEMAGVQGRVSVHLFNKKGSSIVADEYILDEKYAKETIDEALAILDGVKERGKIKRNSFRYEKP